MLTAIKRFEFASSHYYRKPEWTADQNESVFGKDALGVYGHGHNFVMHAGFSGPLDPDNGMIIELSRVKQDVLTHILGRYDHYVLNDCPAFSIQLPTPENMALVLLDEMYAAFLGRQYLPSHVEIIESPFSSAIAYPGGECLRTWRVALHHPGFFRLWGTGGVTMSLSLRGRPDPDIGMVFPDRQMYQLLTQFSKSLLNLELSHTSVTAAHQIFDFLISEGVPYSELVLYTPVGALLIDRSAVLYTAVFGTYTATHRLVNPDLSFEDNMACFGKCHRPHGHTFDVDIWIKGAHEFSGLQAVGDSLLGEWDYQSLDQHPDFEGLACTTENMVLALLQKWEKKGMGELHKLRLSETPNNLFEWVA